MVKSKKSNQRNPLISVIVPAYNVEKFIGKCLESILAQTYENFELIVVDDGSNDYTSDIIEIFAKQDKRIKLIRQENKGVSSARNLGLDIAQGAYIMFVDADDYIEPNTLEDAYKKINQTNSDILLFNHDTTFYKKHQKYTNHPLKVFNFEGYFEDAPSELFDKLPSVWGKLFKNNKKLPKFNENLKKSEDYAFMFEYYLQNPKIIVSNKIHYHYLQHQKSIAKNEDLLKENYVVQSAEYVSNLDVFQSAKPFIKNQILNKYAQSMIDESQTFFENQKWSKIYRKAIYQFLITHYRPELSKMDSYDKLRRLYLRQIFPFIAKIYHKELKDDVQTITILGFNFKKKITLKDVEDFYIKALKKNQPKYEHDTYILSDYLRYTGECIDAYSLFLHMREKGLNAYYIIVASNPLYKKLCEEDKTDHIIVLPDSPKKISLMAYIYDLLLKTKAIITSHGNDYYHTDFLTQNPYWQYIFIQHGQIFLKESVLYKNYLEKGKYNKILISSAREEHLFKKYGFSDEDLIKCGLPRWDLLPQKNQKKKKILVMFTWRQTPKEKFNQSVYKKKIMELLCDEELETYLQDKNVELYFAVHHAVLGVKKIDFKTGYKNIVPVGNVSEYIKECSLLITDFSSVAFDFMFQNKPVLFYLLDKNDKNLHRYDKEDMSGMSYKKYLIGNVFYSWNDTFEKLKEYVDVDFEIEKDLKEKYAKFFYFKKDIRKRLTDEIVRICEEKQK